MRMRLGDAAPMAAKLQESARTKHARAPRTRALSDASLAYNAVRSRVWRKLVALLILLPANARTCRQTTFEYETRKRESKVERQ